MKKLKHTKAICFLKSLTIITLILFFYGGSITAQESKKESKLTISGIIHDEFGETMPSVNVYLKDRPGMGIVSDIDGKFSISAAKNDIIIFSFIGYNNQEFVATKNVNDLDIKLTPSSEMLEETVIVGMGTQR